ncbi:Zn(2)-C6 fungal-type DNA-binding domain [Teratosphaeria destructans]|uniref:Zn(2)-C6 fungal-type DNA-binding domain n=1 Tax=Teratosphaeria destructans TaxID=418781 RepID=A0A9W7W1C7_9PEZI|nr:Zn(2)-C6 fungal-type DNA-binding domain [Teratosphaeria destructans]
MPGILPMKVIKVGVNAQARIAQACDRCRSKKIRCDGIRPCCSQCANVGFECKTSDKLSRRAFPRGYTESLEERVRGLECEVRELKDLLDEKDEKIDMLSRIHSQSSHPIQLPSPRRPSTTSLESNVNKDKSDAASPEDDEVFKVQQSPFLLSGTAGGADSYFAGTSSASTFIEAFKHKLQESGRSTTDIDTELLLGMNYKEAASLPLTPPESSSPVVWKAPPRLVSDQLVNIFFQEWAPLFPVLHRPTFLGLYDKYVADSDAVTDKTAIAQLNLVFGISSLSTGTRSSADLESFQSQWRAAIDSILTENSLAALQALILAQIFCIQQGDLTRLLTYKGLSTTLSARLGLHQSQKRFALRTLTCETRKKVFWTLYTVDCFTAVLLGLPKHVKDEDVNCEYPADADDEYVTERGFQPTLPGESTKLSSALALFRAARILSKVLEEVFPAKTSYQLSMKKLSDLSDDLDAWSSSLAPHLRLQFVQDKPSTGTISSRSPLLSLTYHYIRALIQRPVICASLGARSSTSMITHASSCKSMIQIVQLLAERGMSFSFCLNKDELLVLAGFGLLFQGVKLEPTSKILRDNHKQIGIVVDLLASSEAPSAAEFGRVANSLMPMRSSSPTSHLAPPPAAKPKLPPPVSRSNSEGSMTINPAAHLPSSTRKQLRAIASRFSTNGSPRTPMLDAPSDQRRATVHNISLHPSGVPSQSQPSLQPPTYSPTNVSRSEPALSPATQHSRSASTAPRPSAPPQHRRPSENLKAKPPLPTCVKPPNLDYLSFGNDGERTMIAVAAQPVKTEPQPTNWEKLLGSLDNGTTNIYDACYGGQPIDALITPPTQPVGPTHPSASNLSLSGTGGSNADWNDLWTLCHVDTNASAIPGLTAATMSTGHPESLMSFSTEDGRGSMDERVGSGDLNSAVSGIHDMYRGIVMPAEVLAAPGDDMFHWDGGNGIV